MALEQMTSPVCDGFELSPVALEQTPLPICDGSKLVSIALEQMPLPTAPRTEQKPLSVVSEDAVACGNGNVTGAVAQGAGADAVA